MSSRWYNQWRRSEAHMLPMTKEGVVKATERMNQFKVGWEYGMMNAIFMLEQLHKGNKHIHKFFLMAKEELEHSLRENRKDMQKLHNKEG